MGCAAVLILVAVALIVATHRYRGLTEAMWRQAFLVGAHETSNNRELLAYMARFLAHLDLNPETGFYDFEAAGLGASDVVQRGMLAYHMGDFKMAIESFETALRQQPTSTELEFWLAVSHMRFGEGLNSLGTTAPGTIDPATPSSTLGHPKLRQAMTTLPVTAFHHQTDSTLRAIELFGRLLEDDPGDRLLEWLMCYCHMTLGTFPDGLPASIQTRNPFFDSYYGAARDHAAEQHADLVFVDRASELGIDVFDAGKGAAVEDFDGDGDFDIITGGNFDPIRYFRFDSGTGFVDRSVEAGLEGIGQVHIMTAADYDNDGLIDVFVGRPFPHYLLLHNLGDGRFEEVTRTAGLLDGWLPDEVSFTWGSAWGDIDNDGDLDLFVARWGMKIPFLGGPLAQPYRQSHLFVNNGDGRFADRTAEFGLMEWVEDRGIIGVAFGDIDNDGFVDLFLSGLAAQTSFILRNAEGLRFEEVERHESGFMAAFVDLDHDGQLEIFQGGFTDGRTSAESGIFRDGVANVGGYSAILRRTDDGSFERDRAYFAGGTLPIPTMGCSYGDLDNDGCLDFYLGTGNPEGWTVVPNLMFRGGRDGRRCTDRAADITMLNGFGTIQKGHGIVFADFDDDGDQDVLSVLGGMWQGDRWPNQLFVNEGDNTNNWVKIRLRGRQTNYYGLGARIKVTAAAPDGDTIIRTYAMDNKTGFGSAPYLAHIGLLDATSILEVEVYWPVSGCRTAYSAELNALNLLDEAQCTGS